MKKKNLLFAALVLPFFLGSCSLLDDFFGDGGGYQASEGAGGSESESGSGSDTRIATSMSLVEHEYALEGGESYQLNLVFEPDSIMNKRVTWESSRPNIVSVSSSGKITGLSIGTAVITVTYVADPILTDTCEVYCSSEYTVTTKTEILQDYNTYSKHSAEENYGTICPTTGNPKILILPIWFTDSSSYISYAKRENVRNDIAKAYLGSSTDTGWHSVKSYYEAESFGNVTLNGTVSEWCELTEDNFGYDISLDMLATDNKSQYTTRCLVNAVTDWYFDNHTDSRSNYDSNNDGYIDATIVIYGAPDFQSLGDSSCDNLWAYQFYVGTNPNTASPNPNTFFWASYDFLYDEDTALVNAGSSYSHGDCSNGVLIDTHTLIHEMGHVFGLDDYYDYGDVANPAGGFSMQDCNVGGHDPFSVMAYGWADPYIPVKSCSITINDFQSSHDMILLPAGEFNNKSSVFDEYLLLELYTPTGLNKLDSDYQYRGYYPQGPSFSGIRLWHVDARLCQVDYSGYPNIQYCNQGTSDATLSNVYLMNNNNYAGTRVSEANNGHTYWNLLQLIRDNIHEDYKATDSLTASDLFVAGESFNFNDYSGQFYQNTFNNGAACNWSFTVNSLNSSSATITITLNQ